MRRLASRGARWAFWNNSCAAMAGWCRKTFWRKTFTAFGEEVTSNSVEVHISRLRKRLSAANASVSIHTLRGIGYLLSEAAE